MKKNHDRYSTSVCSHQVSHVVHGQLVGVKSHRGLQVVLVNQPQVALPHLPAPAILHLKMEPECTRSEGAHGEASCMWMTWRAESSLDYAQACVSSLPPTCTSCRASSSTAPSGRSDRCQTWLLCWRTARTASRLPTPDLRSEVTWHETHARLLSSELILLYNHFLYECRIVYFRIFVVRSLKFAEDL